MLLAGDEVQRDDAVRGTRVKVVTRVLPPFTVRKTAVSGAVKHHSEQREPKLQPRADLQRFVRPRCQRFLKGGYQDGLLLGRRELQLHLHEQQECKCHSRRALGKMWDHGT